MVDRIKKLHQSDIMFIVDHYYSKGVREFEESSKIFGVILPAKIIVIPSVYANQNLIKSLSTNKFNLYR